MDMPKTIYKITKENTGTKIVIETAAALVVASFVFRTSDVQYSEWIRKTAG